MQHSTLFIDEKFLSFFVKDEKCIKAARNYNIEKYGGWDYGTCDIACFNLFKLKYRDVVKSYLDEY